MCTLVLSVTQTHHTKKANLYSTPPNLLYLTHQLFQLRAIQLPTPGIREPTVLSPAYSINSPASSTQATLTAILTAMPEFQNAIIF